MVQNVQSKVELPAVSTLELTNLCNFNCGYCQRQSKDAKRILGFFDVELLDVMGARGDFKNTLYIEVQQNGEPTLHPQFQKCIEILKRFVPYVGMSTNGRFTREKEKGVSLLDCITISVHPQTKDEDVERVLRCSRGKVRLQSLDNQWHYVHKGLFEGRVFIDNYDIRDFGHNYGEKNFCIDVHTSVTIQHDGDVVPCCNCVGKQRVLGNIKKKSLQDIWQQTEPVLFDYCKTCRTPNPYAGRLQFFSNTMQL